MVGRMNPIALRSGSSVQLDPSDELLAQVTDYSWTSGRRGREVGIVYNPGRLVARNHRALQSGVAFGGEKLKTKK